MGAAEPHRSDRVGRRVGPKIALGFLLGPLIGVALGAVAGIAIFEVGSPGMWGCIVAGLIFGALGGFWGGLTSLGPPAEADDPLPREHETDGVVEDRASGPGTEPRG
jgi:hypothetical protein